MIQTRDNTAMPVLMSVPVAPPAPSAPQHKLWTRSERDALERAGFIESDRYELIEGELIRKVAKNLPHIRSLVILRTWLINLFGAMFVVTEPAIDVTPEDDPTSDPEPDIIVMTLSIMELSAKPRPEQIRLLVEVSVSTLAFDSNTKASLYARAGIPDYWVLDVQGRRMIVHREPEQGQYRSIVAFGEEEFVSPMAAPGVPSRVGDLL